MLRSSFALVCLVVMLSACSHGASGVVPLAPGNAPMLHPASAAVTITIAAPNSYVTGSQANGFKFAGLVRQRLKLAVSTSGSFTYGLTSDNPAKLKIAKVKGTTDEFSLMPLDAVKSLVLIATATGGGKNLKAQAELFMGSVLYVANTDGGKSGNGSVTEYVPWKKQPVVTIEKGISKPVALAVDRSGNIWVANYNDGTSGTLKKYPFDKGLASRSIPVVPPYQTGAEPLAVDASGNLYCACNDASEVDEFTPSGGSTPSRSLTNTNSPTGINGPYSVVVDKTGNLYVANYSDDTIGISVFAPGTSKTPTRNITKGINEVWLLAMDRAGNLYGQNFGATPPTITEYAPGGSKVIQTFGSTAGMSYPYSLAVDTNGNVYAGNYYTNSANKLNNVVEFTPAHPASPARIFSDITYPFGLAVDPIGNVYLPKSYIGSKVKVFPPGLSNQLEYLLAHDDGIGDPYAVVTWP